MKVQVIIIIIRCYDMPIGISDKFICSVLLLVLQIRNAVFPFQCHLISMFRHFKQISTLEFSSDCQGL